jgi:hypothetical protein
MGMNFPETCKPGQTPTTQDPCKAQPVSPKSSGTPAAVATPAGSAQVKPPILHKQKEMFAKADAAVTDARQQSNLPPLPPPRNHFERVSNVVNTQQQLTALVRADPNNTTQAKVRGDFIQRIQIAGQAFGMNFGLSLPSGGRDGEYTPMNASRFSGALNAEDRDYLTGSQQIRAQFDEQARLNNGVRGAMRTVASADASGNRNTISLREVEQTLKSDALSPFMRQALTTVRDDIRDSGKDMSIDAATNSGSRLLFSLSPQPPDVVSLQQFDASRLVQRLDTQGPKGAAVCDNKISRGEIVRELTSGTPNDAERWMLTKLLEGPFTSKPDQQFDSKKMVELLAAYKKIEVGYQINQTARYEQA